MPIQRITIDATVTASGGATQAFGTSYLMYGGYLEAVIFRNGTASGFSTAGHLSVRCGDSSQSMLEVTTTGASGTVVSYYPRAKVVDASGALLGPATGAGAVVGLPGYFPIGQERIIAEVSSGAAGTSAGKHFSIDFYVRTG